MEIFFDAGLFEFLIAVSLGYVINFIFMRKYLLIIFSVFAVAAPVLFFFFNKGEAFYFLVSFCILNSLFLVFLLWKTYFLLPNEPLIDIKQIKKRFYTIFSKKDRNKK
jgi:hypothetical protein